MVVAPSHWDDVYRAKAPDQRSWTEGAPDVSHRLVTDRADRDAGVVDIGGGASALVDALVADGFADVTVVDLSAAALREAADRLGPDAAGRVRWVAADVCAWRPGRTFAVWHDRAVFHFLVDAAARAAYVATASDAVEPGGHLVVATFAPDGPEQCSGLPVRRYGADDLAREFAPAFVPVRTERQVHATPWGAPQPFTWMVLRRAGGGPAR